MRRIAATALVCVALLALTGCVPAPPASPPAAPPATGTTTTTTPTTTTPPAKPVPTTTVVPNVIGTYSDQATKLITDAGLKVVEKSIHGPLDEDAGEIGVIYRQTPAAGKIVELGTKVEIRYWWESQ